MTTLGIDLGSRKVKIAALRAGEILWLRDFDTIPFYKSYGGLHKGHLTIDFAALELFQDGDAPAAMVATGYGRNTINLQGARVIPEIQAHVAGARFQTGCDTFTLIDLGGQDTKVARVEEGILQDFLMNDKCAASSGRYLENMAQVLDIDLDELARYADNPVALDATCGIFGESELIGKIVEGHPLPHLCAGINATLVKRVMPMLRRFPQDVLLVTGGVARNQAFRQLLQQAVAARLLMPPHPQHNGAIGCAILASTSS
ncbi:CoA-substrate-specific enzyme activase, putative [Geoalkalibacter ferrihydriticus]|uniref:2-hydroxyglutaryl-CoA dehydratase n=2 Tax=Geoalkalibacter ferrihydriticus TaxID=392333 RepID=A0A0C2DS72_9BACT|nr:acyl-CoA dehydratase activase [Geoalkalibacter ferrihydriticus]KIH76304.1 2-hydroxyglutaryl-CoA dehydratase [Geoalkalibacter ferrihydriticus DSM 17813]SDL21797.1 CoA-substrate-specific enzyme activase, putative [Geoalkalibacter ferrihydriticus]